MKKRMIRIADRIRRLHRDDSGLETLQVVLIFALGALVAVAIYQFGARAVEFLCECFYGYVGE